MRQVPAKLASKLYGAAELIADRGLADAKIEDIAEAAGIPKATLYYYFTGKDDILAFLLRDMLESISGQVGAALATPGTARERLRAAVEAQLIVMLENPAACRALIGDLGRATRLPDLAADIQAAFHQPIAELLRDGVADGSLRAVPNPEATALAIFGAITVTGLQAAVMQAAAMPAGTTQPTPDSTDNSGTASAAAEEVCDLLLTGLDPAVSANTARGHASSPGPSTTPIPPGGRAGREPRGPR
jgi:AcrR family transcriptional regulator